MKNGNKNDKFWIIFIFLYIVELKVEWIKNLFRKMVGKV